MRLSVTQENLTKALSAVGRVVSTRSSLPVLSNVLLTGETNILRISATNLEIGITYAINCKLEEGGSLTVPARLFSEFVSSLPASAIELSGNDTNLTVTAPHFESKLNGISAEEFPTIPQVVADPVLVVPASLFRDALVQVIVAASLDEARPVLAGVYLHVEDEHLMIVATDSYRLAEKRLELPSAPAGELSVIVPVRTMQELVRLLGESQGDLELYLDDNQVMFRTGNVDLVSRLIEGQFPNYAQIIPDHADTSFEIDTAEFMRITKVASLFARENAGSIKLEISADGQVKIVSSDSEVGGNTSSAECDVAGEDGEISLNARYLSDALAVMKSPRVGFAISGKLNPCVLSPVDAGEGRLCAHCDAAPDVGPALMAITTLQLTNFRSYEQATFELNSAVTLVVGPNASGKTNLLESLYVLASTKSFRAGDRDLPRHGQDYYRIVGGSDNASGVQEYALALRTSPNLEKRTSHDGAKVPLVRHVGQIQATLFEPTDLELMAGPPEPRRRYLDYILSQTDRSYLQTLSAYKRVLRQRNALLEGFEIDSVRGQIFAWDVKLAEHAVAIYQQRRSLISYLNERLPGVYADIAGQAVSLHLAYQPSIEVDGDYAGAFLDALTRNLPRDLGAGFTTIGPHREDFTVAFKDSPIMAVASRGEVRTVVLALKLAELAYCHDQTGVAPLLLLDDVFSELDRDRRTYLLHRLEAYQTVITTTDADAVTRELTVPHSLIETGGRNA